MRKRIVIVAGLLLLCVQLHSAPVVTLLTDFGLKNEAVGLCHGAILAVDPNIRIVDLCHEVDAYDIAEAALILRGTTVFPKGTVFVTVIDPGVGTAREPVACRTKKGLYYVGPNNGILTWIARDQGVDQLVRIEPARVNPKWEPGTFDGRDLFSPAGAILASSGGDLSRVGTSVSAESLMSLEIRAPQVDQARGTVTGTYVRTDEPYGNVWTDITRDDLTSIGVRLGATIRLVSGTTRVEVPLVVSFGHVPEGKPLAYFSSNGSLAFAINMGDFRKVCNLEKGTSLTVERIGAPAKVIPTASPKQQQGKLVD